MNLKVFCYLIAGILISGGSGSAFAGDKTDSSDEKLSKVYAEHIYTSMCSQSYKGQFATGKLSGVQASQLNSHTGEACKCLYGEIEKKVPATDITDYVMYVHGSKPSRDKETKGAMSYNNSAKIKIIGEIMSDKAVRKKCGFIN